LVLPLLLASICLWPQRISSSCDPAPDQFQGFSFLSADMLGAEIPSGPALIGFGELYEQYGPQRLVQRVDNVAEWRERFCDLPRAEDISTLVYKASIVDMEELRTAIASKSIPVPAQLRGNSFAHYLERHACTETVDYLIFAKECEPYVTQGNPWEDTPRSVADMEALISKGLQRFLGIKSHYIRLRYAYQLIRLAHYAGKYARVLELYAYLMPKIDNDPSLIEYWIEGHRAGALLALGDNVEASYRYAVVFKNCPSRRQSALQSFQIRSDEEWQQCLLKCRDDRERATLYVMRAYDEDSHAVEEMYRIYELDPSNEHLEPLLVKEMEELEQNLLGQEFNRYRQLNRSYQRPGADAGERIIELQQFVRQLLLDQRLPRLEFWKIAEGYLEVLAGDYYAARKTFEQAEELVDDRGLRRQLEIFQIVLRVSAWSNIDDEVEEEIVRLRRRSDLNQTYPDLRRFLSDKLTYLYRINDRPGKALLSQYSLRALKANPREEVIEDLMEVVRKDKPTQLEREMIRQDDGSTIENELIDMQALNLFNDYQLEAALENLKQIDRSAWDQFGLFNPFAERINDCVECPLPDSLQAFNRGELIEQLLDMEYQAKANAENRDLLYYRLGVAFYNMSYFSYSWRAMDYYRSGASLRAGYLQDGDNVTPHPVYPYGNREHFDCSMALYYFQKARQITVNPELAARATFWAAKCERNEYYVNRTEGAVRSFEFFQDLVDRYRETAYYQRVIDQCATFRLYAGTGE